ncbi:hypothetical protein ACH5RR_023260 [Cinchona calisaya]|uniref:RNase H type-1 domain-containing protein n=1 Tax=Cinchona calisaya TaxID=153742 RepID=A0ABD2ZA77_9GENT
MPSKRPKCSLIDSTDHWIVQRGLASAVWSSLSTLFAVQSYQNSTVTQLFYNWNQFIFEGYLPIQQATIHKVLKLTSMDPELEIFVNPGRGIARDGLGGLIFSFAYSFVYFTNLESDSLALLNGLQLCLSHGFLDLEIEMNSQVLLHMITGKSLVPWKFNGVI